MKLIVILMSISLKIQPQNFITLKFIVKTDIGYVCTRKAAICPNIYIPPYSPRRLPQPPLAKSNFLHEVSEIYVSRDSKLLRVSATTLSRHFQRKRTSTFCTVSHPLLVFAQYLRRYLRS